MLVSYQYRCKKHVYNTNSQWLREYCEAHFFLTSQYQVVHPGDNLKMQSGPWFMSWDNCWPHSFDKSTGCVWVASKNQQQFKCKALHKIHSISFEILGLKSISCVTPSSSLLWSIGTDMFPPFRCVLSEPSQLNPGLTHLWHAWHSCLGVQQLNRSNLFGFTSRYFFSCSCFT